MPTEGATGPPTTTDVAGEILDGVESRAWFGLLHAYSALVRQLDADLVARHGLPLNAFEVLLRLAHAETGQLRMSELARDTVLSLSGVSRLVDRLEREGLLERRACESDARGSFAAITEAGRARMAAAQGDHVREVRALFQRHLAPEELERLGEFWDRLSIRRPCA